MMKHLVAKKSGIVGGILVMSYLALAIGADLIAPYDPLAMHPSNLLQSPNHAFLAGTDQLGRDVFSRLVFGARISLYVAILSVAISAAVGGLLGAIFGYFGGVIDGVGMRLTEILMAFPSMILALALVAFLGASIHNVVLALAISYCPVFIRMARGSAISLRERDFVLASKAIGASTFGIIRQNIVPNIFPVLLTQFTLSFSSAILFEAALSFLGLGVQPPTPSWGNMLGEGRQFMLMAPWLTVLPGLTISIIVIGINLLGDAMRDVLDPRLHGLV
jgi:ABC-type dipeptide/oligopeptide/nickel transport system permease subunit